MKSVFQFSILAFTLTACDAAQKVTFPLQSRVLVGGTGKTAGAHRHSKRAVSSFPITDYRGNVDLQWYATVSIGTPPQNLTVVLDTGSGDLVIPRSNCSNCANQTRYDPSKSSSFANLPGLYHTSSYETGADTIPLGQKEIVTGQLISDIVSINGFTPVNQSFLALDTVPPSFNRVGIDGVLGLPPGPGSSFPNVTNPTFFWQLYITGQIPKPVFSLLLQSQSGEGKGGRITLGGIDDTAYTGPINYVGVNRTITQTYNEWIVNSPGVTVNGAVFQDNPDSVTLIDSGTAYIRGPSKNATKALYASISPKFRLIDNNGAWGVECDVMKSLSPVLTFTLVDGQGSKVNLTLDKDSFSLGEYPGQKGICQGVVLPPFDDPGFPLPFWVIGSPLIKAYYSVWDGAEQRIGFASIKSGSSPGTTGPTTSATTTTVPKGTAPPNSGGHVSRVGSLILMLVAGGASLVAVF